MSRVRCPLSAEAERLVAFSILFPHSPCRASRSLLVSCGIARAARGCSIAGSSIQHQEVEPVRPNNATAPNRLPRFPFSGFGQFEYRACAPTASPAAVGKGRR